MRLNGLMSNVKWRDEAAVGVGLLPWASYMFKNHEAQWPHMSNVKLCACRRCTCSSWYVSACSFWLTLTCSSACQVSASTPFLRSRLLQEGSQPRGKLGGGKLSGIPTMAPLAALLQVALLLLAEVLSPTPPHPPYPQSYEDKPSCMRPNAS